MIWFSRPPVPSPPPGAGAPAAPGDDPAIARGWPIEAALLRVRWGAAALALLPALGRADARASALLLALGLALGNAALARLLADGPTPARLRAVRRWATALEWAALLGAVGLWSADPASPAPPCSPRRSSRPGRGGGCPASPSPAAERRSPWRRWPAGGAWGRGASPRPRPSPSSVPGSPSWPRRSPSPARWPARARRRGRGRRRGTGASAPRCAATHRLMTSFTYASPTGGRERHA